MNWRMRLILLVPAALASLWFVWLLSSSLTAAQPLGVIDHNPRTGPKEVATEHPSPGPPQQDRCRPIEVRVVVFTSPVDPEKHAERAAAIRETWGAGGIFNGRGNTCVHLGTTISDVPQPAIEDTREWIKAMLGELAAYPNLSWVLKVEDTAELVPGALAELLHRYHSHEALLLGNQLQTAWAPHHRYLSGAGFAVSHEALNRIFKAGGLKLVPPALLKIPDVGFSAIARRLGAHFPDTRDNAGGERFNVFPPHVCAHGAYHEWYVQYKKIAKQDPLTGSSCCAADSVLFQYVGPQEQRALPDLLDPGHTAPPDFSWPGPWLFDRWDSSLHKAGGVELELLQKLRRAP